MTNLSISQDQGARDIPLIEQTIGDFFDAMAARLPEHEALVSCHQQLRYTYRQLQTETRRLASALLQLGLQRGDRIGIWSHNNAQWLLTQLATAQIGAVLVNINPAYRLAELEYALNKVGCKALIAMPEFKHSNYIEMIQALAPELAGSTPGALVCARLPDLKTVIHLGQQSVPGMLRFADFIATGDAQDARLAQVAATLDARDPINIQFTSGTTGFPKGATLTHRNILNNGFFVGEAMRLTEQDRLCIPVPLYHCFGMVLGNLACLTHGATIVYPNDGFEPLSVLQAVQHERCTGLHGVPTMFIALLDHPRFAEFDLSTLRTGIMAGSPCPIEVMKRVVRDMHMAEVTIAYGMTETSPVSCQSDADTPLEQRVATVGRVQPHLEVKIADPDSGNTAGATVAIGATGELCTRGYSVMHGYWGDPEKTAEAIDADGWMHTGDLATMDAQGFVNIVGRIKDMVIRGGENIYPREIEEFLYRHPAVQDVQVVGVPDPKYGEELCAWIVLRPGASLDAAALRTFCEGQIAHYKIPRYMRFVDAFPMTVTGKVQKFKMREVMKEELKLDESKTA
ncbi:AMP-binding protein [Herminiimonas sp. CN]|uniref:AMP-binding protein n=1 Tax=Herminiimonas sp. CN TaxID=1349818 RepID=UPI0035107E88